MNTATGRKMPSASALLPPRPAPISVWLDLVFVLVTMVLVVSTVVSQSVLVGLFTLLPVLYVVLVIMVRRPIWAFGTALVVQNFSGFIKQALNYSQASYFVQDAAFLFLLVPLVLRRVVRSSATVTRQSWTIIDTLLALFVVLSFIQAFNPVSPSPLLGLAALRVRFLPLLMFVFVRGLMRDGYKLEKPLFLIMGVCAVCGALFGMYESHIGIAGVQALGPGFWPKQTSRTWGDAQGVQHFRPPSIYTDAGIAVVVAGMYSFMAMLRPYKMSLLGNIARWFGVLLCVTQVIVTGSRSGFLAIMAGFVFLAVWTRSRVAMYVLLGLPLAIGLTLLLQPQMLDRYVSVSDPGAAYQTNRGYTIPVLFYEIEHHPLGYGTGTATIGAGNVATLLGIPFNAGQDATADNGWVNVLHETGIAGLALYLTLLLTIFGYSLGLARNVPRERSYLPLTMTVWTFVIIISTFGGLLSDAFPINVYYWSTLAMMLAQADAAARPMPGARM